MKKVFSTGLILIVILSSCRDNEYKPNPCPNSNSKDTVYISSSDLQNCKYKTGTYWVFVDSVTNIYDSVAVISFNQGVLNHECNPKYEFHSFKTLSSYSAKSIDYLVYNGGIFKDRTKVPNLGTSVYAFSMIYMDYNSASSFPNCLIERLDSIFIYDQYYKKVLRVEVEKDPTENQNKSVYFMNSEFGFLRHDIYRNDILTSQKLLMRKEVIR